ncbi:MAG: stress-induced protein [Clostridia bacterium]|nr:stress-induced protein [Clostridia bacterium]
MNEKNLIPNEERTPSERRENARKAGIASGKARREKKTIQKILADLLDSEIKDSPQFAKLASKMGVESDKSVKDIFTMVCLLNSVKSGNLGDLERLSKLLGEDKQNENADVLAKLDKVIGEVDKLAE